MTEKNKLLLEWQEANRPLSVEEKAFLSEQSVSVMVHLLDLIVLDERVERGFR